jgi:heavy metal efflux system protein
MYFIHIKFSNKVKRVQKILFCLFSFAGQEGLGYKGFFASIAGAFLYILPVPGQQPTIKIITMNEAVTIALANHPVAKNTELKIRAARINPLANVGIGNTELNFAHGQMYSAVNDEFLEIKQYLGSPVTHIRNIQYQEQQVKLTEAEQKLVVRQLTAEVKSAYSDFLCQIEKVKVIHRIASIYDQLLNLTGVPYQLNDTDLLKRITAETLFASFQDKQFQAEQEYRVAHNQLQQWLNCTEELVPADTVLELYAIQIFNSGPDKFSPEPYLAFYNESLLLHKKEIGLEQSKLFPEFTAGYFNHEIAGTKGFQGFMLGFSMPLWYFPQKAKIAAARINKEIVQNEADYQKFYLSKKIDNLRIQLDQSFVHISFFRENALKRADLLTELAVGQIRKKDIDYIECIGILQSALEIQLEYLEKLRLYNKTAIELEHYIE